MSDIVKLKRAHSETWTRDNPVLDGGEPGYEKDTRKHKLGDGVSHWNDIEYAVGDSGDDGAAMQALQDHINSSTPHSVYDDGPSLALLYENVKAG